jgi:hypothetical protein
MQAPAHIWPESVSHVLVGQCEVEPFGVEVTAAPAFQVGMLGIVGIGHDGEEVLVARYPADIFGRPGAGTGDAGGCARRFVEGQEGLDLDSVAPIVAEVVEIGKGEPRLTVEIQETDLPLVESACARLVPPAVAVRIAVAQAADIELVQMIVPSVESGLDDEMELAQVPGPGHDETTPGRRLDLVQGHADLQGVGFAEGVHPATRPAAPGGVNSLPRWNDN